MKVPILLHNARSRGGMHIMDHCIVRILDSETHEVLYSHPKYHRPVLKRGPVRAGKKNYPGPKLVAAVYADGKLHARFTSGAAADRWIAKMSC